MVAPRLYDAIIVGAGAAGMFCAALAGQRGRRILLIDHSPEPGRKILISGGGRCNFTNIGATRRQFPVGQPPFRQIRARAVSRRRNSSLWSIGIGSPGTRRRWASCSATALRGRSSTMLLDECAAGAVRDRFRRGAGRRASGRRVPRRLRRAMRPKRQRWCSPAAAFQFQSSARPASPTTLRAGSASRSSSRARRWFR